MLNCTSTIQKMSLLFFVVFFEIIFLENDRSVNLMWSYLVEMDKNRILWDHVNPLIRYKTDIFKIIFKLESWSGSVRFMIIEVLKRIEKQKRGTAGFIRIYLRLVIILSNI